MATPTTSPTTDSPASGSPSTSRPSGVGPLHHITTLDNGLRVVTGEMPHTRSVSISVFVGVGSRHETESDSGASHFLEHLLFKGTTRRPDPEMVSGAIEGVGGILNAETDQEMTAYWCKVPQPYFADSLDLLIDLIRNPLMASEEIERERSVVIDELAMIHDHPDYKVDSLIDEMLWPNHPLGRDVGGTKETVSVLSRDVLVGHLDRYYSPTNTVVSVAGAVDHQSVVEELKRLTGDWEPGPEPEWAPFSVAPRQPQVRMDYRRTEQAHVSIALPGLSLFHPDRYALGLLSVALGEGMSSRLFLELRERKGLAYDVHSGVTHFLDCGAFQVSAGTEPRRVYDAVDTILTEVAAIREGISEEEVNRARQLTSGRLMLRMEDTRAVSSWFGSQELLAREILDVDDAMAKLDILTAEDIDRVAKKVFTSDGLSMAVVGPCRGQRRLENSLKL